MALNFGDIKRGEKYRCKDNTIRHVILIGKPGNGYSVLWCFYPDEEMHRRYEEVWRENKAGYMQMSKFLKFAVERLTE